MGRSRQIKRISNVLDSGDRLDAHAMDADREKALAAGCDDFDTKPSISAAFSARWRFCCAPERSDDVLNLRQIRHDLRTPLNHIVGYAELALESACEADDGNSQEPLKQIVALGHGLTKIIDHRLPKTLTGAKPEALIGPLRESLRPSLEQIWMITGFECFNNPLYAGTWNASVRRSIVSWGRLAGGSLLKDTSGENQVGSSGELILVADDDPRQSRRAGPHASRQRLSRSMAADGDEAWRWYRPSRMIWRCST